MLSGKKILLIEDEPVTAKLETKQLESYGYSIQHVSTGEAAIERINKDHEHFGLILMDIDLGPGLDGTETAEAILKIIEIPILFLSSHTEPEIVEKTENISSYGYVVKSSSPTVLDASIKMALKLFKAQKETQEKEALLLAIAENYPNSYISIIEKDYSVGFTSGQEFKKMNLDPEQFVGLPLEQVFGDQTETVRKYYAKTFAGEECEFELFVNDQHQLFRTVPFISKDGFINQILAVVENTTKRKKIELINSTMAHMLDVAPNSITIHNQDGDFLYANQKTFELHGYSAEEFMSLNLHDLDVPESAALLKERFEEILCNGYAKFHSKHFRKDGSILPVEVCARTVEWDGETCVLSIATEITAQVH